MKVNLLVICIVISFISCHKQPDRFWVVNNGVPGNTTADLLARMDDVYKNGPGLVVVLIGTNDATKLPLPVFIANLDKIDSLFKLHNIVVLFVSPPPRGTDAIAHPDRLNDKTDAEIKAMDSLSVKNNCFYLDLNTAFKAQGSPNPGVSSLIRNKANTPSNPDGVHPTNEGFHFIARQVHDFITQHNLTKHKKISCFGDSITRSLYPEQLEQLLNGDK